MYEGEKKKRVGKKVGGREKLINFIKNTLFLASVKGKTVIKSVISMSKLTLWVKLTRS